MGTVHQPGDTLSTLRRRWERERAARLSAEAIAEAGLRQLHEQQRQLQLLEAVAAASNQAMSLEEALAFALAKVAEATGWGLGHAWRVEARGGNPRLLSTGIWHGAEAGDGAGFREATEGISLAANEGLPGRVLATGEAAWVADVRQDGLMPRRAAAARAHLRAGFAFPVVVGKEVLAVLEFFDQRAATQPAGFLRLMSQIGAQLGRVAERRRNEIQLMHDASHDPLTGLPNRALFLDRLARAVARQRRHPEAGFAVLYIDLDRFKVVNDSLGHQAGDKLLLQVASRLEGSLRQSDTVARPAQGGAGMETLARMGGDEFTVLLDDLSQASEAVRIAERIQETLARPFAVEGHEVYATASIGIASSATGYASAEDVLRDADLAMYRAKSLGKARYEIFDQRMHASATRRLALETALRHALDHGEFVLHYQPVVRLDTAEVKGFEALVRWQPPGGELVYPADFIEVAEDTGLIVPLGLWVLREACGTMHRWHQEFPRPEPLTISVNLSARQFAQPDLVGQIEQIVQETGIAPQTVQLEITESVMMSNTERTVSVLAQLRQLGVRFSIDDFGTGYSSLSYLHRFPLDVLKIDRSFVAQMGEGRDGLAIVRTIMDLARSLRMHIVAEGTETDAHVAHLRRLGCECAQGFYFSRPVEAAAAAALLRTPGAALAEGVQTAQPRFLV